MTFIQSCTTRAITRSHYRYSPISDITFLPHTMNLEECALVRPVRTPKTSSENWQSHSIRQQQFWKVLKQKQELFVPLVVPFPLTLTHKHIITQYPFICVRPESRASWLIGGVRFCSRSLALKSGGSESESASRMRRASVVAWDVDFWFPNGFSGSKGQKEPHSIRVQDKLEHIGLEVPFPRRDAA